MKQLPSSEPIRAKRPLILLLVRITIFFAEKCSKMRKRYQLFFGMRLVSKEFHHSAIKTKIEQKFGGFFHQIKVPQLIGRQDSMQTMIRTSRRLDSILHEAAQNFEVFLLKYIGVKLKNLKPIAVDVLLKAFPMRPLSCRFNLAGRYL